MLILICDDDNVHRQVLYKACKQYLKNFSNIELVCVKSGQEVLDFERKIDLLLLDIDMPGLDGISVKERLSNTDTRIIFITNHDERVKEAFGANVFAFIDKDNVGEQLPYHLEKAIGQITNRHCIIGDDGSHYDIDSILYIEGDKNYIRLHLSNSDITPSIRKTVKEMASELKDYYFVQISREYIVNIAKVSSFSGDSVIINEKEFSISVRRRSEFSESYKNYLRSQMQFR